MNKAGVLLKLFAAAAIAMVLLLATATWFFFKRPLTLDAVFSRFALGQAGLTRRQLTTVSGKLTLFEGGQGPILILLHDVGEQAGAWARIVTPLVEDYRVVIPDLSGHGSSDPGNGPIPSGRLVSDFAAMVADCCPEEAITQVGHGLGAWVAFQYAADKPDRVSLLVAVNGGPHVPNDTHVNLFPSDRAEALQMMEDLMGTEATALPGYVLDDIVRQANTGPASRIDFAPKPPTHGGRSDVTTFPVTLVWGARDELYDLAYASRMGELFGDISITTLEECGHMPQRECPVAFVEALTSVLESTDDLR